MQRTINLKLSNIFKTKIFWKNYLTKWSQKNDRKSFCRWKTLKNCSSLSANSVTIFRTKAALFSCKKSLKWIGNGDLNRTISYFFCRTWRTSNLNILQFYCSKIYFFVIRMDMSPGAVKVACAVFIYLPPCFFYCNFVFLLLLCIWHEIHNRSNTFLKYQKINFWSF